MGLRVGDRVDVRQVFGYQHGVAEVTKRCKRSRGADGYDDFEGPALRMVSGDNYFHGQELRPGHWHMPSPAHIWQT